MVNRRLTGVALFAGLCGCTSASDVIVPDDTDEDLAPDVTGTYALVVTGADQCPGATDWLGTALVVSGPADALLFDFGDVAVGGSVDSAFAFDLAGSASAGAFDLDITGSGVAYTENDRWVLDGDIEIVASGVDSPCSASGTFQATQGS